MFALRTRLLSLAIVCSAILLGITGSLSAQTRGLDTSPTTLIISGDRARQIKDGSLKRVVVGRVIDPATKKEEEIFRDVVKVTGSGIAEKTGEIAIVVELGPEYMVTPPIVGGGGGGGVIAKKGKWTRKLVLEVAQFNQNLADQFIQRINAGQERDMKNASKAARADGGWQVFAEVFETENGPANFTVKVSWGDKTDIDLWITEPDGTKVGYSNTKSANGGHLFRDIQQGPGHEEYQIVGGMPGTYKIAVNLYTRHGLPPGTTRVTGEIVTNPGTAAERRQPFAVDLTTAGQTKEVGSVPVPAN
ncbi:MAG: hypothetical protein HY289_01350 [Planctomycetes bacterium]|nr:hypothetical protein [Planctomycetota bacterium]